MKTLHFDGNNFLELCKNLTDDTAVILEKDKAYHLWEEDCFRITQCYCSNTATQEENPDALKITPIYIENKNNIVFDGNGATIIVHGIFTPYIVRYCKNVTIKNLTVDYFRPTMNEFTVLSNKDGKCTLKINEECLYRFEGNTLIWQGENGKDGKPLWEHSYRNIDTLSMYYDPKTRETIMMKSDEGCLRPSVPAFKSVKELGNGVVEVELENKDGFLPEGCVIQSRWIIRDQVGGFFERVENLRLENLTNYSMYGLGLMSQYCNNVTYSNIRCIPKEGRTASSNADFFHFAGCMGKVEVSDCTAYGAHDDFINIHGLHLVIAEKTSDRSVTVRFGHSAAWGLQVYDIGETVEFIKGDTLIPFFTATVTDMEIISNTDIKLTLDKDIPDFVAGKDAIANLTRNPSVLVKNNHYGPSVARGVLVTTCKDVVIEGNTFDTIGASALLVADDCNFWFESGYTKNIVFRNNILKNVGYGFCDGTPLPVISIEPEVMNKDFNGHVHGKILIENNKFIDAPGGKYVAKIGYTEDMIFSGNENQELVSIVQQHSNVTVK